MYTKARPAPGQLENCEICNKRFTVTPYSKAGPDGGLLCTPCGKELKKDAAIEKKAANKGAARPKRRKVESDRLDGIAVVSDICATLVDAKLTVRLLSRVAPNRCSKCASRRWQSITTISRSWAICLPRFWSV